MLRALVLLCCSLWVLAAHAAEGSAEPPRDVLFEYLYIDANEAQASGGHAAVRMGTDVFHFQYQQGLLIFVREDWGEFQLAYRGYQNRNIHSTRIEVSPETYDFLFRAFVRRYITQSRQVERLRDVRVDLELLNALLTHPPAPVSLPGFGFFDTRPAVAQSGVRRGALRTAILAAHGDDFLQRRQMAMEDQLRVMPARALEISATDFVTGSLPRPQYAFNERYGDILAGLLALQILGNDAELSVEALGLEAYSPPDFSLSAADRVALNRAQGALQSRLVKLVASSRPDWGVAMLLGLARLEAVAASLHSGRWVFLDILDSDATSVDVGPSTRRLLPQLQTDSREIWLVARDAWLQEEGWSEAAYAELEASAASWRELRRVQQGADQWRIRDTETIPKGLGLLDQPPVPPGVAQAGETLQVAMTRSSAAAGEHIETWISYSLLTRNCVSELFTTIDAAMAEAVRAKGQEPDEWAIKRETVSRLGGIVDPSVIPFVSSKQVRRHWRVQSEEELPSLRRLYIAAQRQEKTSPWVPLRESSALTSSVYRRSDTDSFFIFFTDGKTWTRPLFGLANLGGALGMSVVGAVQAPFDGGRNFRAGVKGALFSLPELGFQNIRKGTITWLPPELRSVKVGPAQTAEP